MTLERKMGILFKLTNENWTRRLLLKRGEENEIQTI